ncbi:MAG: EamA family transporter [Myxococcales bacterium]|nr:EamA family transporter [Myxococcales bacterium]
MRPQRLGALLGLLAALTFGVSAPLSKLLLEDVEPTLLAGLLYLGAGLGLGLLRLVRADRSEAPLTRRDLPPLAGVVLLGGVLGPVLLLFGLDRVSGAAGALLLNLEAPLTILLAAWVFGEHLGRRAALASACILAAALVLRFSPGEIAVDGAGVVLIAAACLCWALDNNLTQRLTLRDPVALVRIKTLGAGLFNTVLAFALGASVPAASVLGLTLLLGLVSYGVSVVLDAYALRLHGAAREAAYFAAAPFIGALASLVLLGDRLGLGDAAAMALMIGGVALLLREDHDHEHTHEPLTHNHRHVHDAHHEHAHGADDPAGEPHAHVHTHPRLTHRHAHVSDLHHRHMHS